METRQVAPLSRGMETWLPGHTVGKTTEICRKQTRCLCNGIIGRSGHAYLLRRYLGIARSAAQVQVRILDPAELLPDRRGQCARTAAHGESIGRSGCL